MMDATYRYVAELSKLSGAPPEQLTGSLGLTQVQENISLFEWQDASPPQSGLLTK
jgi:hypothetical protein